MNCGVCNHREVCRWFPNPEEYCSDYEPERPNGEWKKEPCGYLAVHKCSNCGFDGNQLWHYCPNCGAIMSANGRQVTGKLNSEIIKSNSEIIKSNSEVVPDYRDGWKLKEGGEK